MSLISLLAAVLIIALVLYIVRLIPDPMIQKIAYAVVAVVVIIWLLQLLGALGPLGTVRIGDVIGSGEVRIS